MLRSSWHSGSEADPDLEPIWEEWVHQDSIGATAAGSGKIHLVRYWWVNHKQTFRHEFEGRYIWVGCFLWD